MGLFQKMGQYQILVISVQYICRTTAAKGQAAAAGQRLQQQMDLRVVPQGLKITHAFHRGGNGLFISDAPGVKGHIQGKPLFDKAAEDLQLYLAHDLGLELL